MSEGVETKVLDDWLGARAVIVTWLRELIPQVAPGAAEKAAEALLARFAAHEPPLLLMTSAPPAVGEDEA